MVMAFWGSFGCGIVILAASVLAGGMAAGTAAAADLGGNCCVDLEERVAELEATTARKGNRKVSLTLSGQVSTALMFWDDGRTDDAYVVDNAASRTGFQLDGAARIGPNLTAGFELVLGISAGSRSSMVNQNDDDATVVKKLTTGDKVEAEAVFDIELAYWYLAHKHLGRLGVGRVGTASDNSMTVDLGGAGVIANAEIGRWQRGMFLTLGDKQLGGTWDSALGGSSVNAAGLSRNNAVSYTTSSFAGFSAAVAWSDSEVWDAALRYAGEFRGFYMAGAVAYVSNGVEPDAKVTAWQGSGSIMHVASGLYLSGAFVAQDNGAVGVADTTLWYVQGGISRNWTGLGSTVLYAEFARVNDGIVCPRGSCGHFGGDIGGASQDSITGSEATVWGLGIVQHIDAAAMELFLAYRRYSAEITSPDGGPDGPNDDLKGTVAFSDFNVVMSGARIRF
jgi:hypothetical protein